MHFAATLLSSKYKSDLRMPSIKKRKVDNDRSEETKRPKKTIKANISVAAPVSDSNDSSQSDNETPTTRDAETHIVTQADENKEGEGEEKTEEVEPEVTKSFQDLVSTVILSSPAIL